MIRAELDDSDLRLRPQLKERERKLPIWLLRLPLFRNTRYLAPRNSAVISLVVVFPALPVIATTFVPDRRLTSRAIDRSARVVSATRTRPPGCPPCSPIRSAAFRFDQRADGSSRQRRLNEVVPVEPIAANRDEELPRLNTWNRSTRSRCASPIP